MGREIKFRAKCFGNWRYGNYIHFVKKPTNSRCNINYKDFIVTNEDDGEHYYPITELFSLGQYIGLEDHKGVKIFEGDILESRGERFVIEYIDNLAGFCAYNAKNPNSVFGIDKEWISIYNKMIIVGTITDNPEILK